jgi:hypothetical protein
MAVGSMNRCTPIRCSDGSNPFPGAKRFLQNFADITSERRDAEGNTAVFTAAIISPSTWATSNFVPFEIMPAATIAVFSTVLFRFKQKLEFTCALLKDEYAKLGKWANDQKITLIILIAALYGHAIRLVFITH